MKNKYIIAVVGLLQLGIFVPNCNSSDYQEQLYEDYQDSYISRHNSEIESYSNNDKYKADIQELRDANMRNLYINSTDYRGETIIMEQTDDSVIK